MYSYRYHKEGNDKSLVVFFTFLKYMCSTVLKKQSKSSTQTLLLFFLSKNMKILNNYYRGLTQDDEMIDMFRIISLNILQTEK